MRIVRPVAAFLLAIAVVTCVDSPLGPNGGGRARAALPFAPRFSTLATDAQALYSAAGLGYDSVRVIVSVPPTDTAHLKDTTVFFAAGDSALPLDLAISADPGTLLDLELQYLSGHTVLYDGTGTVTAVPLGVSASSMPAVITVNPVGPGAAAKAIGITPAGGSISTASPVALSAVVDDSAGKPIAGAIVIWTVSDTSLAAIGVTSGVLQPTGKRGTVVVTATTLNQVSQSVSFVLTPPPTGIVVASGGGQSSLVGTALSNPVNFQVRAADGLGVAGQTVSFSATQGASVTPTTAVTDSGGFAQTIATAGTTAGAYQVSATLGSLVGQASETATAPSVPTKLVVTTAVPSTGKSRTPLSPAAVVQLEDGSGNAVSVAGVSVTAASAPAGLGGTTAVLTDATGKATFSNLSFIIAGNYTITFAATSLTSTPGSAVAVSAGPASQIILTSSIPTTGVAGNPLSPTPVAQLADADGNFVAQSGVNLTVGSTPSGVSGTVTVATDGTGKAVFSNLVFATTGSYTVTVSGSGLASPTSTTVSISAAAAAKLALAVANPPSAVAGVALSPAPVVQLVDGSGNAVTTAGILVAAASSPTGIGGTTTVTTDATGKATFSSLSFTTAGSYTLSFSAPSLTGVSSGVGLAVSPAAASVLVFTAQPSTTAAGVAIAPAVVLAAKDAFGNTVPTFTSSVTVSLSTNPTGAALSGTLATSAVSGVATFSNVALNLAGTGYVLSASASGVSTATSAPFAVTSTTSTIIWTSASSGNWSAPTNWNLGRVPQPGDSVVIGSTGGTYTVTLDTTFTGASIALGGTSGTQTLSLSSRTLTLAGALTIKSTGVFAMSSATVIGAGSMTNAGALNAVTSTIALPLANAGALNLRGTDILSAGLTTTTASAIAVIGDGSVGAATAGVLSGFTNNGSITLTSVLNSQGAAFALTSGTLVNAPGATIVTAVGTGGPRTIAFTFSNQGTITLSATTTLGITSAASTNSGVIDASAADLTISQSGSALTNTGRMTIGAGHTLTMTGGIFGLASGGTLNGGGAMVLNGVAATFDTPFSLASVTSASSTVITISSGVTLTAPNWSLVATTVGGAGSLATGTSDVLNVVNSTITTPISDQGTLQLRGAAAINGGLTTASTSVIQVIGDASYGAAAVTMSQGFTNNGQLVLTSVGNSQGSSLTVSSGTLVNTSGGAISTALGNGGPRTIAAELNNAGTVTLGVPLTIGSNSANSVNTGTIDATAADLTISQSGSFANGGTITVGSGHTLTVTLGTFIQQAGGNVSGSGTASFATTTVTLNAPLTGGVPTWALAAVTIGGTGLWTVTSAQTITLTNSTVAAPITNQGTVIARGAVNLTGSVSLSSGSFWQVRGDGSVGTGTTTVSSSLTNDGEIDLTSVTNTQAAVFVVSSGTLTNSVSGVIKSLPGSGGARTLTAQIANAGTITSTQPMTMGASGAASVNSGTIDASAGDITITQPGTGATFVNNGILKNAPGHTVTVNNGQFTNQTGATMNGNGTLVFTGVNALFNAGFTENVVNWNSASVVFALNVTATSGLWTVSQSSINGPGTWAIGAGQLDTITTSTISAPIQTQGTIVLRGTTSLTGAIATSSSSILSINGDGGIGASAATVSTGFTNNGIIQLTSVVNGQSAGFTVNGTLTNAAGASIRALPGTGGSRALTATITNAGSITATQPLFITVTGTNSNGATGTVDASAGDITLSEAGASPTFTNSGAITLGTGHTLTVVNGTFTDAGTLTGAGTLAVSSTAVAFNANVAAGAITLSNAATASLGISTTVNFSHWYITGSTLNGPGTWSVATGQTDTVTNSSIGAPLTNSGTIVLRGTISLASSIATTSTSVLQMLGDGSVGTTTVTVASGFTNAGEIDLTSSINGQTAAWAVTSGTFTNSGTINVLPGTGGARQVSLPGLTNQGTITATTPLALALTANSTNTGTIDGTNGDITISQTGSGTTLTNASTGKVKFGTGHTFTVSGGNVTQAAAGQIIGTGTLTLQSLNVTLNGTNVAAGTAINLTSSTATINSGASAITPIWTLTGSTVSGAGSWSTVSGQNVTLISSTINVPFDNFGKVIMKGTSAMGGTFMAEQHDTLQVVGDGSIGQATATFAAGFTNNGLIELTSVLNSQTSVLTLSAGTLSNSSTGTISALVGTGGARTINSPVANSGTLNVFTGGAGLLTLNCGSLGFSSFGTINVSVGGTAAGSGFGQITVGGAGSDTVGGTMNVTTFNAFTPTSGQTFLLLQVTTGSLSGAGRAALNPPVPATLQYTGSAATTMIILHIT